MRTVRDANGRQYLLVKRSEESSLVRDPDTGAERYLRNDRIEPVEGESALETAATGVPDPVRRVVTAAHDDRSLGLLVALADGGPRSVVALLDDFDLCESDLHGLLAEFRAAGLIEEVDAPGGRGYAATETTERAVALLRGDGES